MGQLVIGKSVLNNLLSVVITHPFLFMVLLILPFSNSPLLSNNLLGITGMKPFNLIVVGLFLSWVIQGGSFIKFAHKLDFKAMRWYFLYVAVYLIAFGRSFFNHDVILIRFYTSIFPSSPFGFLLSYLVIGLLLTFSFVYILNLIRTQQQILSVVITLVCSLLLFNLFSIMVSYNVQTTGLNRNNLAEIFDENFGFHYNVVATIIMIGVPVALGMALELGKRYFVILGIMIVALVLAGSRGALAAAGISMIFVFFMSSKNSMAKVKPLLIITMTILLLILFSDSIISIISGSESKASFDEISNGRWELMWSPLLDELLRKPMMLIFGLGFMGMIQTDAYVYVHNFYQATHAHNLFLNLLVDCGLIILLPFMLSCYYFFRKALKVGKSLNSPIYYGLLGSIVAYMIAGLSGRQFFPGGENMMLFPIIALMVAYARLLSTKSNIS